MLDLLGTVVYGNFENDIYDVVERIGNGSFGVVYRVKNRFTGTNFALKTFQQVYVSQREELALFNEGKNAVNIVHPNVVRVIYFHDGFQYPNLPPYMLMEYISGNTLDSLIKSRSKSGFFEIQEMIGVFTQLVSGMKAINERLIHRDIKPDNILVEKGIYKITDFGLSKIVDAATRTETLKNIGAKAYYAPEAWRGEKNTIAMDMYSMGIVFYQIATLIYPYQMPINDNWQDVHFYQDAPDPNRINSSLKIEVVQMIMKMMAKSAIERYQSWDEILERLHKKSQESINSFPDLSILLQKDTEVHRREKAEELANAQQTKEQEENLRLVNYSITKFMKSVETFVEYFNHQSDLSKLGISKRDDFSFSIHKINGKPAQRIDFTLRIAEVLPQMESLMQFNRTKVKVWGIVTSPSGYGFNVLLVSSRVDDLYGEWRVMNKSVTYPMLGNNLPYMSPFSLEELASKVGNSNSYREKFSTDLLVPLFNDVLSN